MLKGGGRTSSLQDPGLLPVLSRSSAGQLRCEVHPRLSLVSAHMAFGDLQWGAGVSSVTEVLGHPAHLPHVYTIYIAHMTFGDLQQEGGGPGTSLNHKMAALP